MTRPSVYEAAGGADAFLALATANHERCLQDPVLSHPFSHGGHPDHAVRLGPPGYSTSCGGHPHMLRIHAGSEPEESMGPRFVECFVGAADDAGLPADPSSDGAARVHGVGGVRGAGLRPAGLGGPGRPADAELVVEGGLVR